MKLPKLQSLRICFFTSILFLAPFIKSFSQKVVDILPNEYWYGALANDGNLVPFETGYSTNMNGNLNSNQGAPLLLSSKGRYIWSDYPFAFKVEPGKIVFTENKNDLSVYKAGNSLKDAFVAVSKSKFPTMGLTPDTLLFTRPQYNTWIELIYNQNQEDILKYAHDIINHGFPSGVLMIDDNWAPYYGRFVFRKDRFPDAKAMITELHELGFKVMLWVCPFINPVSEESRALESKRMVLMDSEGNNNLKWKEAKNAKIVKWWNGYSMVLDFTNPAAVSWFQQQLDHMVSAYGLDGFKFDAGDPMYYTGNVVSYKPVGPNDHSELYGQFGLKYPLNEYRAMWKRGGQPLVERLLDKEHTWEDLNKLIPDMINSGLLGYSFNCPDMIGGGNFTSFLDNAKMDQELIVRSAQCHALMPMMQFSVAPWRVLDSAHFNAVKKTVALRMRFSKEILGLAQKSAVSGEPMLRNMEYEFPNQGFEKVTNQFMLGETVLVAPVLTKGNKRTVVFPKGVWKNDKIKIKGPASKEIVVPLDELLWFRKIK